MKILTAKDIEGNALFIKSYKDLKDRPKAFCNGCDSELIFKEGKAFNLDGTKRKSHFAHKNICECDWTNESDLHKIIKHIIFESKFLKVSSFDFDTGSKNSKGFYNYHQYDGFDINIEDPKLELYGGNMDCSFRPDVCGTWNGDLIWIEAVVTHRCEENKIKYILDNDITCIEVSVDPFEFKFDSKHELEQLIKRGFNLFNTKVINIKGLRTKIVTQEKIKIRKQLKESKDLAYKKTSFINDVYNKIGEVRTEIEYSSLNNWDKENAYDFLNKLIKYRTTNYINYQISKDTLKSAVILHNLVSDIPKSFKELREKCMNYCNDKMKNNLPVFKTGIYKGKQINQAHPLYIEFIHKTQLNIFSSEVLEYAEVLKKWEIPDFYKKSY